jgi:hypothetical protein
MEEKRGMERDKKGRSGTEEWRCRMKNNIQRERETLEGREEKDRKGFTRGRRCQQGLEGK